MHRLGNALKRSGIALLSTRRAFRGYGVACYNHGYSSSSGTLFIGGYELALVGVFTNKQLSIALVALVGVFTNKRNT